MFSFDYQKRIQGKSNNGFMSLRSNEKTMKML